MGQFSWSFSKKKTFDQCPRRHNEVELLKRWHEESEALTWGNRVHECLANALSGKAPLPPEMLHWQKWVQRFTPTDDQELLVEQQWAITRDFQPCEWFGPKAWFRGKGDAVILDGPTAIVIDWKTGKSEHAIDSVQLALMAQCIFCFHPEVRVVATAYIFLKEDYKFEEVFKREDMVGLWERLLPEVAEMEMATKTGNFPAQPGKFCFWCPVQSCEHHRSRKR